MGGEGQLHLNWQLGFQDISLDKEAWCTLSLYSNGQGNPEMLEE